VERVGFDRKSLPTLAEPFPSGNRLTETGSIIEQPPWLGGDF
jgi:hypothetical protein